MTFVRQSYHAEVLSVIRRGWLFCLAGASIPQGIGVMFGTTTLGKMALVLAFCLCLYIVLIAMMVGVVRYLRWRRG